MAETTTQTQMVRMTIDGMTVNVPKGTLVIEAARRVGVMIPHFCYHPKLKPDANCRMCLVEIEKVPKLQTACSTPVDEGMTVRTATTVVDDAHKSVLEFILANHPLDCPVCDADGHCELQDMAFQHGVTNLANAKQKFIPEDTRSLVLDFNMNRCIACAECINVCKDVLMIDALQFMKKGGFNQVVAKGDLPLACEFCGDCLAVCPVGAITNKFSKYLYKPWQMKKTTTTCNYCGDGCQMYVETKDTEVIRITSPLSWKNKWGDRAETAKGHGGLCVKGRFGFEYIDAPTMLEMHHYCYARRFSRPEWRRLVSSTPVYAIYDDHDFGTNDSWGGPEIDTPMWKRKVWEVFKQNWVNPSYGGGNDNPGCWFDFHLGDVHFIMLDCRYYRTNPKEPNPSMLGPVQKAWLMETLKQSKGTFRVICSSVPWVYEAKGDSLDTWNGYKAERTKIFDFLAANKIGGVLLLSADRHRSDLWKIERPNGYALYEFNSSRLTNIHKHPEMKNAIFSYNKAQSFGLVTFDLTAADPSVTYAVVNIDGEKVHEMAVKKSALTH